MKIKLKSYLVKSEIDFTGCCVGHLIQTPTFVNPRILASGIYSHKLASLKSLLFTAPSRPLN